MSSKNHLLIIGTVWPEPNSSAAGSRMLQLIELFLEMDFNISFASPTLKSDFAFDLGLMNINCYEIKVNDSSFNQWLTSLNPTHVLFDRFMMEEQFGWRIKEVCPQAFRIIDTEDLHCLRKVRQACFKNNKVFSLEHLELAEITKREIASIIRSDISIMISKFEIDILTKHFEIPEKKLFYLPFIVDDISKCYKSFNERRHFMTIGSFRHEPNVDSVLYLKTEIWPKIRKQLPEAEIHIYGSYPKQKITQLHNPKHGFIIKGWAESAQEVIENSRVMLAPLRFGAGQKGKFLDALKFGTPSITTSIGAEGMVDKDLWSGYVLDNPESMVEKAVELYSVEEEWNKMQAKAIVILESVFLKSNYQAEFKDVIERLEREELPFYLETLNYHSFRNSRFMSKWIEEKNKD